MNIDELIITNVSQRKMDFLINIFYITFELDGFQYELRADQGTDGLVHPKFILHSDEDKTCKFCENYSICGGLSDYTKELFHRLIEFPSIRLQWLYIKHA